MLLVFLWFCFLGRLTLEEDDISLGEVREVLARLYIFSTFLLKISFLEF